jgi:hypothetical protein
MKICSFILDRTEDELMERRKEGRNAKSMPEATIEFSSDWHCGNTT